MTNNVKSLKKQLMAAIAMVVVAAIALSSATYAWFVNNARVQATDVSVSASTAYSLLISQDNETWGTTTALNGVSGLTPVSTTGEILGNGDNATEALKLTAAEPDNNINKVGIGDGKSVEIGDLRFTAGATWKDNYMTSFAEVSKDSEANSDKEKYFYTDTVYLKAAQNSNLLLDSTGIKISWTDYSDTTSELSLADFAVLPTETIITQADIENADASSELKSKTADDENTVKSKQEYNENLQSAQELLKTLRVGFVITTYTNGTADDTSDTVSGYKFFEYQLVNTYINDDNAINTTIDESSVAEGIKKAVKASTGTVAEIESESLTSGSVPLIIDKSAEGSDTSIVTTSDQSGKDVLATMSTNEVVKCDIYVWMEGCDYDTVAANISSFSGTGVTGLQFGFCLGEVSN